MSRKDEPLISEMQQVDDEASQPRLPGWVRFGLIGTGAAFALGSAGGIVLADSPKTARSPKTVSPATVDTADTATNSPATVDTPTNTPATVNTPTNTPATVATPTDTPDTPDTPIQAATAPTTDTDVVNDVVTPTETTAVTTPTGTTADTTPTANEATATQTATTPTATTPTTTAGTGLMIGQLFHAGLNDAQLSALADALGMDAADVANMSLGQLLRTVHAAGVSTQDVADLLHTHATS